jgi:hypothetical protein
MRRNDIDKPSCIFLFIEIITPPPSNRVEYAKNLGDVDEHDADGEQTLDSMVVERERERVRLLWEDLVDITVAS